MAEWFKRGTVNTFYRGSNPLKALIKNKLNKIYYTLSPSFATGVIESFPYIPSLTKGRERLRSVGLRSLWVERTTLHSYTLHSEGV